MQRQRRRTGYPFKTNDRGDDMNNCRERDISPCPAFELIDARRRLNVINNGRDLTRNCEKEDRLYYFAQIDRLSNYYAPQFERGRPVEDVSPLGTNTAYGECWCGCGQKTSLAKRTDTKSGHIKGEPLRYLQGHYKHPKGYIKAKNKQRRYVL